MDNRRHGNDKNYRGGRNANNDRGAGGAGSSRDNRGGKGARSGGWETAGRNDRPDRPFRSDNASRPGKSFRSGNTARQDKPFRTDDSPRPDRPYRPDKSFRSDRPFRSDKPFKSEKPFRTEKTERIPKRQEFEKPDNSDRFENDLDKLEGRNPVMEALKAGRSINKILVAKGEREGSVTQIVAIARQNHIVVQEVDRSKLDSLSTTHAHQGVIAFAAAKDYVEVADILEIAEASGRPPFLIILDEITDAYNLGSILRTADAAGVHGVIIPKRRAIGLTAAVSKASAGAMEHVPVARVTNITQTIEQLKKKNIWVVGTDSSGEKPFFKSDLKGPIALVVGSEGEGMGKLVRESCDFTVSIPMLGRISSLNAAVAGAIVMYEILRQRSN